MGVTIEIEAVDRTNDIAQSSVRYKQTLSKAPATFSFSIEGNKVMPEMGDAVLVKLDGDNFFRGTITDRSESMRGSLKTTYDFVCMDGFYELDRKLVIKAYTNTDVATVMADILTNYTSGFTLDSPVDTPTIKTVRFNYEQPSRCIQKLMNAVGWDWYVDQENVVHIFAASNMTAPFEINDTEGNHVMGSLKRDKNINELKNVVYIRGGEYEDPIAEADAVDKYEANGVDNTFPLVYRYSETEVTINGTPQTVGVDFINEPADFDCLYNFQEKLVRFPDGTLTSGQVVRVFGNAKVPLIVQASDDASVAAYGEREGLEINKSINSVEEAELLAGALLDKWREGASSASFKTKKKGWVVGQTVTINSTVLGLLDDQYKINSVAATLSDSENFIFSIELIKSGQTTFMDMLVGLIGQKTDNITISDNEVLQRIKKIKDVFGMTDEIVSMVKTTGPYGFTPVTTKTASKFSFSTFT